MKKTFTIAIILILAISSLSLAASFDFQNTDLRNALEEISSSFSVNIIASNEVSGLVNASFECEDVEEALKKVLLGTNYSFAKVNGIYLVGGIHSPDESHSILFKSRVIYLKDTFPSTVYELLGTLSKYVVYSPKSMIMIVDADEMTTEKIMNLVSKIDVPNSNRFFSYEIHELSKDEYQRFRQFESSNKSGLFAFSNSSFDIFKEIVAINGSNDTFGTVALPKIGNMEISSSDPSMKINVESRESVISAIVKTGGNAIAFEMNENENNHTVISLKEGKKRFLILVSTSKTPKDVTDAFMPKQKKYTTLTLIGKNTITKGEYMAEITYGSTALSVIGEGKVSDSTPVIGIGLKANLIDEMYATMELKLKGTQLALYGKIEDTTSISFFKLRASLEQELTLNGFGDLNFSLGGGISLWNINVFGGLQGNLNFVQPYVEADARYDWMYATLLWKYTEGYTIGGGMIFTW